MAQKKLLFISATGVPQEHSSASDEITFLSGQFGNVLASGNSVVSTDTNGDLELTPNGTGDLVLDGVNWPQADGTVGQYLSTDGAGQLSWVTPPDDTEANLIGNIYTADEALAACDALYISAADNVSKASATGGGAASQLVGFAQALAADTDPVTVVSEGVLSGFSGLTPGSRYYLSATAGAITTTIPVGSGNSVIQAGFAKNATTLHIHIEQMGRRA
jgi:hypothetical protein